jgi:hypothetical protein
MQFGGGGENTPSRDRNFEGQGLDKEKEAETYLGE